MDIAQPLFGEELTKRLSQKIVHIPIIDSFLYKGATLMISSQPSVGKSVLAIQGALQLVNGLPLFGGLSIPTKQRVWYIQMERSEIESLERLQLMIDGTGLKTDGLYIDVELQALNFLNESHLAFIIKRGLEIKPDVIIIDPLYGIAIGLSKDEVASNVAKVLTHIKKKLGCALWVLHHTVKNPYEIIEGKKVEKDDPFYGAQWLKAHVTASYFAKQFDEGVTLYCKKDSHASLMKEIKLTFDHDTYISTMKSEGLEVKERYRLFCQSIFRRGKKTFFFEEARLNLGCATTTLRELNRSYPFKDILKLHKLNGQKTLYEVVQEHF